MDNDIALLMWQMTWQTFCDTIYHRKLESGQVVPHEMDYFLASLTRVTPYKGHST